MRINNKGFTVIELIVSFSFAVVILGSMLAILINYEQKSDIEQTKSNLLVFKNTILEVVYQDIISKNTDSITSCGDTCITIITQDGNYRLELIENENGKYLSYRNNQYLVPDSENGLSRVDNFIFESDLQNKIYKVSIPIIHAELSNEENNYNKISIIVSGKKTEID